MRTRVTILLMAAAVLIFTGACNRTPAEPTPTISGLVIIKPTAQPTSTATLQGEYPAPAEVPQVIPTQTAVYPGPEQITPVLPLEPTTYPEPENSIPTQQLLTATLAPTLQGVTGTATAVVTAYTPTATGAAATPTLDSYPVPAASSTSIPSGAVTPTSPAYPGPAASSTPIPSGAATPTSPGAYPGPGAVTPTTQITGIVTPTPTVSGTPPVIPEEIPPIPAVTPPPAGSLVRIWYSMSPEQSRIMDEVIDAFQDVYPGIRFEISNYPQADLQRRYETASYNGGGPSLLFAPAEWGPAYYESGLVRDLAPYASEDFLSRINPAALGTGMYQGALISLPVSQEGVVLYRNIELIPEEAETFDDLIASARAATRAGNLGAYFDRGAFFSAGNLGGLGGGLMDDRQNPLFNSPAGLAWLDLMKAYDVAGAVGLNTNRDLELFRTGRIGYIIEGTWQISSLSSALGEENLAIDPWPSYETGHLSGFVQADSIYLNPNARPGDMYAAMLFIGYLLTPDVQQYLAEVGMIPVITDADPRPVHIAQAAIALSGGMAYPPVANIRVLTVYWEGLEMAIQAVFSRRIEPQAALLSAEDLVKERLSELIP
jgi:arabinogalactan oligomer/maltooligosaccharide transport system substrate-binding protein